MLTCSVIFDLQLHNIQSYKKSTSYKNHKTNKNDPNVKIKPYPFVFR